jgi:phosphoglycolate phosphatase-like HAD superfamily hydrolase
MAAPRAQLFDVDGTLAETKQRAARSGSRTPRAPSIPNASAPRSRRFEGRR